MGKLWPISSTYGITLQQSSAIALVLVSYHIMQLFTYFLLHTSAEKFLEHLPIRLTSTSSQNRTWDPNQFKSGVCCLYPADATQKDHAHNPTVSHAVEGPLSVNGVDSASFWISVSKYVSSQLNFIQPTIAVSSQNYCKYNNCDHSLMLDTHTVKRKGVKAGPCGAAHCAVRRAPLQPDVLCSTLKEIWNQG